MISPRMPVGKVVNHVRQLLDCHDLTIVSTNDLRRLLNHEVETIKALDLTDVLA